MLLDIPSESKDSQLQDRYNRQIAEKFSSMEAEITLLKTRLDTVKEIPASLTTVAEIIQYLKGV